jgi:hypothetical protein
LQQVGGFLRVVRVSFTNKTDHLDINEILLKVAINTITTTPENIIDQDYHYNQIRGRVHSFNGLRRRRWKKPRSIQ